MKRPSFQFYPADLTSNANLKRCTWRERGIWVWLMCLMHDSEEYGILRWPLEEIAMALGCEIEDLEALHRKGVLKGQPKDTIGNALTYTPRSGGRKGPTVVLIPEQEGPIWYSSRMVVDEYVRNKRANQGATSQNNPNVPRKKGTEEAPDTPPKDTLGASLGIPFGGSPTSTSTSTVTTTLQDAHADAAKVRPNPDNLPPIPEQPTEISHLSNFMERRGLSRAQSLSPTAIAVYHDWLKRGLPLSLIQQACESAEAVAAGKGKVINSPAFYRSFVDELEHALKNPPEARLPSNHPQTTRQPAALSAREREAERRRRINATLSEDEQFSGNDAGQPGYLVIPHDE